MTYYSIVDYQKNQGDIANIQANITQLVQAAKDDRLLSRYNSFIVARADTFIYFVQHPDELYTGLDNAELNNIKQRKESIILHALLAIIADLKPGENETIPIYSPSVMQPLFNGAADGLSIANIIHRFGYRKYYSYLIPYLLRMSYRALEYNAIFLIHYDHFINESSIYYNFISKYTIAEYAKMLLALNIVEETFPLIADVSTKHRDLLARLYGDYAIKNSNYNITTPHFANFASYMLYLGYQEKIRNMHMILHLLNNAWTYDPKLHDLNNYARINAFLRKVPKARRATRKNNQRIVAERKTKPIENTSELWDIIKLASEGNIRTNMYELNIVTLLHVAKYGLAINQDLYELYKSIPDTFYNIRVKPAILLQMGFPYALIMTLGYFLDEGVIYTAVMPKWSTQKLAYCDYAPKYTPEQGVNVTYFAGLRTEYNNLSIETQILDYYAYLYKHQLTTNSRVINKYHMARYSVVEYNIGSRLYISSLADHRKEILRQLKYVLPKIYNQEIMQQFKFNIYVANLFINLPSYYDYTLNNEELCRKYNIANIYTRQQIMVIINDYYAVDEYYSIQYYRTYDSIKGDGKLYSILAKQHMTLLIDRHLSALLNNFALDDDQEGATSHIMEAAHLRNKIIILSFIDAYDLSNMDNLANFVEKTGIPIVFDPEGS